MKKAYETPNANITVFNTVEDILSGSDVIVDTTTLWEQA